MVLKKLARAGSYQARQTAGVCFRSDGKPLIYLRRGVKSFNLCFEKNTLAAVQRTD